MARVLYRYRFHSALAVEDIETTLVVALQATECLHGEEQVRLDAAYAFDPRRKTCVIDGNTAVGRDCNRLFAGFLRREFGDDAFQVRRLLVPASTTSVVSAGH